MKKTNWIASGLCALAAALCVVLTDPRAEIGLSDEWSYALTTKHLAESGHIIYNGWATAMLGVQLYLGALFVHLFGFSFLTLRAVDMVLFVGAAILTFAILTRCGIRTGSAVLGTLTLTLSPLYISLATTFMSDAIAMFFVLLFFYAGIRCDLAKTERSTVLWLAAATLASLAGGSVRQIVFLCNLVALPGLIWSLRRRRNVVAVGLPLWFGSFVLTFLIVHWFGQQPYTAIEKTFVLPHLRGELLRVWLPRVARSFVSILLLTLPVLFAIALKFPIRLGRMQRQLLLLLGAVVLFVGILSFSLGGVWWGRALLGNYVAAIGVTWDIVGPKIVIVPGSVQIVVAFFLITATLVATWTVFHFVKQKGEGKLPGLDRSLLFMAVPFTAAYLLLVYTRSFLFDRYFLPILFLAILFSLRWFERRFNTAVSWLCFIPLVVLASYGVAETHDRFVEARAELAAIQELRAAGVSRSEIDGGFEYNGWTEVENTGYVNEPRMHPSSAYHPLEVPEWLRALHPVGSRVEWCYIFFYPYTPSIHARYTVQRASNYCFADASAFAPVRYRTWLPPFDSAVYIGEVPKFR